MVGASVGGAPGAWKLLNNFAQESGVVDTITDCIDPNKDKDKKEQKIRHHMHSGGVCRSPHEFHFAIGSAAYIHFLASLLHTRSLKLLD